jgi:hypothetical protein
VRSWHYRSCRTPRRGRRSSLDLAIRVDIGTQVSCRQPRPPSVAPPFNIGWRNGRAVIAARICWNMARSTMISAGIVRVIASGRPVPTLEFTGAFAAKQHDGLPRTRAGVEVRVRGFRIPRRSTSELESGGVSYLVPTWPGATGSRSPISHVHGRRGGFCPGNSALPDSREASE